MNKKMQITATPEKEDFFGKYESSGRVGNKLVNNYFNCVKDLISIAANTAKISRALEVGCGPGISTKKIAKFLPSSIKLDASEYVGELVKIAQKNNPDIKVWQEDIYKLKSQDNTYDLIFLLEVLEHLDYPEVAILEIKRVLKPGGMLIVGVPREPLWRLLNMTRGKYLSAFGNTPGHLNHWSATQIIKYTKRRFGQLIAKRNPLPWTMLLLKNSK